jgi:hypothetical protein
LNHCSAQPEQIERDLIVRQTRGRSRAVVLLLWLLLLEASTGFAMAQSQQDEYQVKAAFLYHFAQLVEWPAETAGDSGSFPLCIFGDDPFHGQLEDAVSGKQIGPRTLQIRHVRQPQEARACRVLFIGKVESRRIPALLPELQHSPVLTVGETDGFLSAGGIIRFCLEGNKVRFEINRLAADSVGLKVSSRLLLLAKNVVGDHGGK